MQYSIYLKDLLLGYVAVGRSQNIKISHIIQDSREFKPGSLFVAYPGLTHDGRDYISEVIKQGAAAVIYESIGFHLSQNEYPVPVIAVANLAEKLSELAARFYKHPSRYMKIIGVTGTNGKTSVSHFIAECLAPEMKCAVMGTLGVGFLANLKPTNLTTADAITLQKNLAWLQAEGAEVVAMEVSSHALDQHRVASVDFDIAVFTQLSRDHLDYHSTMQKYADAKAKLFSFPSLSHRVINGDDGFGKTLIETYQALPGLVVYSTYSRRIMHSATTICAKKIQSNDCGFQVNISSTAGEASFNSPLLGQFNVNNLLSVLGVLICLQIPFQKALNKIEKVQPIQGRLQQFGGSGKPLVIVDYSHTPDSLEKALVALREHCKQKIWCVFGCGGDRDAGKRASMGEIAERHSDFIIITNDNPRFESPEAIVADICSGLIHPEKAEIILDREKAIKHAVQTANDNDIVLIAGKGHETYQIFGDKILPFSDQEHVENELRRLTNETISSRKNTERDTERL